VAASRNPRRRNPAAAAEVIPDFPLGRWIDSETGESFETVTVRLDDGRYLCLLLSDPTVRATADTRRQAEAALFKRRCANPDEDAADVALSRSREGRPGVPWSQVKRKRAR
jgi:hypothetical protein